MSSADAIDAEAFQKLNPKEFVRKFVEAGTRPDGRHAQRIRHTVISTGTITTADGSALVRVGDTTVVAGVRALVGPPTPLAPRDGQIEVNVHFSPLCAARFIGWRAHPDAIAASELLKQTLASSDAVPPSTLCIDEGVAVWVLQVDVVCLNYGGSAVDAAQIALMAALRNTRLPEAQVQANGEVTVNRDVLSPLRIGRVPLPLTAALFEGKLLFDPTVAEEDVADAVVTVMRDAAGNVCCVHKPGGAALPAHALRACLDACADRVRIVAELMDAACARAEPAAAAAV